MYIKRLELCNFKSFGGRTTIPLLTGFTVISGPNGSGKSNLIDALLFCLGLAGSKGMRAERLPDLVNQTQSARNRSTIEASVTVTFELDDEELKRWAEIDEDEVGLEDAEAGEAGVVEAAKEVESAESSEATEDVGRPVLAIVADQEGGSDRTHEWSVTRKLRVTQQGTYTSNYYINGEPCTLTELHDALNRLRIYPEGYNVVLQGDVTRIISMNARERREIIDELAGVATFDRKIEQAKGKLDAVKDREDRYHIVEKELIDQRDRLAQDRIKAEKYQKLRQELQAKTQWELVIHHRHTTRLIQRLQNQIVADDRAIADLTEQIATLGTTIQQTATELEQLNVRVKSLGEEEQLALQATLATREAELRQLQRQEQDLQAASREVVASLTRTQQELQEQMQILERLHQGCDALTNQELPALQQARDTAKATLEADRDAASQSAASAEAWVQEQTTLRHQIDTILQTLDPQRTEQAGLRERIHQLDRQIQEQVQAQTTLEQQLTEQRSQRGALEVQLTEATQAVQNLAQGVAAAEQELQIQQDTQIRLQRELREKQRRLDKLEAETQAIQEAQGTHATQLIMQMGLTGVCGLVANLARVEPLYQLALETAAGARMGHLVVEDDATAAAAIEILKQRRAGRATFLPLNKIQAGRPIDRRTMRLPPGCIDYAIHLIEFESRYHDVFSFVLGQTLVFETLSEARRHLGQYRMVTLDGELLEPSGAMTGGSISQRQTLHFGTMATGESAEVTALRDRITEIERILIRCEDAIHQATQLVKQRGQQLAEARQQHREYQLQAEQMVKQMRALEGSIEQVRRQLEHNGRELTTAQARSQSLEREIPTQEHQLQTLRQTLDTLEQSQTHSEWQQIQTRLRSQETELNQRELALRSAEQRLRDLDNQRQRAQEKIQQAQDRIQTSRTQQSGQMQQQQQLTASQTALTEQIAATRAALAELEQRLGSEKQQRDRTERQLREQQTQQQEMTWQQQKLQTTQQERRQELRTLQEQQAAQQQELPDPLPEVPADLGLEQLQQDLRSLQKRLQAMEPVNMLALEEYDRTQARLEELSEKLRTLEEERTELLLRIENFTTLRQRAFKEAFDVVDANFQTIFASLSDGDGRLQLDDPQDPFNGGLTLIAHPKGKPVQRLASMSGGEKSLTALSFIFALQRYRPSPFYAFDEVDMFLDGANVERLSKMIKRQSEQAQFIVVSLRRPMIEAAQRTIGVTQARGAYTQVLGINLMPDAPSPQAAL